MRAWRLAAAYVGSVIGAGFASGQEVLRFFGVFGLDGYRGMAVAGILLSLFGYLLMERADAIRSTSHHELLVHLCGGMLGRLVDLVLNIALFASLGVMLAGAGALLNELWGIPPWTGVTATAVITAWLVHRRTEHLTAVNAALVAALLAVTLFALLPVVRGHDLPQAFRITATRTGIIPGHWFAGATVYAAFNAMLAASPLGALGTEIGGRRATVLAALLGGGALTAAGLLILTAILQNLPDASQVDVPVLHVLVRHWPSGAPLYALMMMLALLTSCIAAVSGLARRLALRGACSRRAAANMVVAAAIPLACLGFGTLVETLYPAIGYAAIAVLVCAALRAGMLRLAGFQATFK